MWGRKRSRVDERDEIQTHIRLEADRLMAEAGLSPREALAAARATFGPSAHLEPTDRSLGLGALDVLMGDARQAARRLVSAPVSSLTILASLVVGIGVNTAIFSLADQTLVRELPVQAPDELVSLAWDGRFVGGGRGWGDLIPHPLYADLRQDQEVFSEIAARSPGQVTLQIGDRSERAQVELVTGSYFSLLGIRPRLGRLLGPDDDRFLDGHPVVVLSHDYWTSRFGADPDAVGRELRLNGRSMTIVGVAPPSFHGTDWSIAPVLWVPMMMNDLVQEWGRLDERRVRFQQVFARLRPGVTREGAEAALQGWFAAYLRADMLREGWPTGLEPSEVREYLASRLAVRPAAQGQAGRGADLRAPMLILTAATVMLLLLACLNVANLSLAKAAARHRDAAVRTALGATRARVAIDRLIEAGLLAGVGGALGVLLAPLVSRWILGYMSIGRPEMAIHAGLDRRSLVAALSISVAATVLSGVGPAWFAASADPMGALKSRGGTALGGLRARRFLVIGQIALALVFLVGAGLFWRSLSALQTQGPGFESNRLVQFTVTPGNDGYELAESKRTLEQIQARARRLPGVSSASIARYPVLAGNGWGNSMLVEGAERFVTEWSLPMNAVTPGFFATLGVPLVLGRDFDSRDRHDGEESDMRVAIVSEDFVRRYLPGQNPLGVRIDFGSDPERAARMEIVGVVRDFHEHGLREARPQVYFPLLERTVPSGTFLLRSDGGPDAVVAAIPDLIREIDPNLTVTDVRTMDEQIDRLLVFERMLAFLGRAFATFATLLATIGIYAVLSFAAESRTKEMGIRVALGASRRAPGRLIVGEAVRLAGLGVLFASPAVWLLGRGIQSQLFGVDAIDPSTGIAAAVIVVGVCVAAAIGPARKATAVSPVEAFRVE